MRARSQLGAAEHATAIQRLRSEVALACGVDTSSSSSSLGAFASLLDKRIAVLPALLPEPVHATAAKNASLSAAAAAAAASQSSADAASVSAAAAASGKTKSAKSSAKDGKDGKDGGKDGAKEWSTPVPASIRGEWLLPSAHAADPMTSVGALQQTPHTPHTLRTSEFTSIPHDTDVIYSRYGNQTYCSMRQHLVSNVG